jgi:hypothetical protein
MLTNRLVAPALMVLALTLSACSSGPVSSEPPGSSSTPAPTANDGDATAQPAAASGDCPAVPQAGFELTSDDSVTAAPSSGQTFGDGTPISWTIADLPDDATVDIDLYWVNSAGDAVSEGGMFLDDEGGGTWDTSLSVFTSAADGRPGFAVLGVTSNSWADGSGHISGDHVVLGVYCLSLKADA